MSRKTTDSEEKEINSGISNEGTLEEDTSEEYSLEEETKSEKPKSSVKPKSSRKPKPSRKPKSSVKPKSSRKPKSSVKPKSKPKPESESIIQKEDKHTEEIIQPKHESQNEMRKQNPEEPSEATNLHSIPKKFQTISEPEDLFLIQPRNVCPGDYFKYKESQIAIYSNKVTSQVAELNNLMIEFRQKKKVNEKLAEVLQNLKDRQNQIEKEYESVRNIYFKVQEKASKLSDSLGKISQRQNLINGRNSNINRILSKKVNIPELLNERDKELKIKLDKYKVKLQNILNDYFHEDYSGSKISDEYFSENTELGKRRKRTEELLKEIDERNTRMFVESIYRLNLRKSVDTTV